MKIDFDKIICINLTSVNAQQLFAICETYFIGFEALYKMKTEMGVSKYWFDENDVIGYEIDGVLHLDKDFDDVGKLKNIKQIRIPKTPKTEQAVNNYKAFLEEGYDIRTPSMDKKVKYFESLYEKLKNDAYEIEVETKIELPVILEVDVILEKIFKYGIDSLTNDEKIFLDNQ